MNNSQNKNSNTHFQLSKVQYDIKKIVIDITSSVVFAYYYVISIPERYSAGIKSIKESAKSKMLIRNTVKLLDKHRHSDVAPYTGTYEFIGYLKDIDAGVNRDH